MTWASEHFMGLEHDDLRERLCRYLRGHFPSNGAKLLARAIDCDPRTAENILLGHWPNASCWRGIARAFGRDVLEAVFAPDINPVLARLTAEERLLEERLHDLRARRRQAQGSDESRSDSLDQVASEKDDRTLDLFEPRSFGGGR